MGGWDRGLDFRVAYERIREAVRRGRGKSKCYAMVLAVQLTNGSRISEAFRAAYYFSVKPNVERVDVPLGKSRGRTRLMVKPEGLDFSECTGVYKNLMRRGLKYAVRVLSGYAIKRFGFNTHSLRYAYITHLLSRGENPAVVARLVGHRRLDIILSYVQEKHARRVLGDVAGELTF